MKNQLIFIVSDKREHSSFWESNIRLGIRQGVSRFDDDICELDENILSTGRISGEYVLVVGGTADFSEHTARLIEDAGAHPVIVNAGMLPSHTAKYSGIVFGLESIVGDCMSLLKETGRTRTVMFGLHKNSLSDRIKHEAFGDGDAIFVSGHIEDCAEEFVRTNMICERYDSALCANDTAALCLIRSLNKLGVRVPEDFAVIGFGNSYVGANLPVPLTSVDFDYRLMGEEAVRLIHMLYDNPNSLSVKVTLPCRLMVRATTGIQTSKKEDIRQQYPIENPRREYFDGDTARDILRCEEIFQSCKQTDRDILLYLLSGETIEHIAEKLSLSDRAVRYRVRKLTEKYGFTSRGDMTSFMSAIIIDAKK